MIRETRRQVLAGVGGGTAAALVGGMGTTLADEHDQSGDGPPTGGLSTLRVAHMSPDAPNVDVYVGEVMLLEDVPFTAVSQDFVLRPGQYRVRVAPTGADLDEAVIDAEIELGGRAYTALATGEVSGENRPFYPLVHPTRLTPLDDGTSRIRFFHLSPDAPAVDIVPAGSDDPLFRSVGYTQNRTAMVPADEYTLEVRPAGEDDVVEEFDVNLAAGWIYTGFAVGYVSPAEAPADVPLDLVLTVDGATPS